MAATIRCLWNAQHRVFAAPQGLPSELDLHLVTRKAGMGASMSELSTRFERLATVDVKTRYSCTLSLSLLQSQAR